jgi:hypothetical protein
MESTPSIARASLNYGLIYGMVNSIFFLVGVFTGIGEEKFFNYLSYAIVAGLLFYTLYDYRKSQDVFKLKSAIGLGTLTATIGGLISGIVSFIYLSIDNSFITKIKQKALDDMYASNPDINEEAVEMASKMMDMTISPTGFLVISIFGSLFIGFIASFILGLFLRKGD